MEQNKVRSYTLYALGEILLVVIGILIALQVNNWNEGRKEQALKQQYLQSLQAELSEDYELFDKNLRIIKRMQNGGRYVLPYFEDKDKVLTDSLRFFDEFHQTYIFAPSFPDPIIWEELQNSGNLNLFQAEDVLEFIYSYYNYLDKIKSSYDTNVSKFISESRYFDSSFFSRELQDDIVTDFRTDLFPGHERMQELRELEVPMNNINGIISGVMVTKSQLNSIKEDNEELRAMIQELIHK